MRIGQRTKFVICVEIEQYFMSLSLKVKQMYKNISFLDNEVIKLQKFSSHQDRSQTDGARVTRLLGQRRSYKCRLIFFRRGAMGEAANPVRCGRQVNASNQCAGLQDERQSPLPGRLNHGNVISIGASALDRHFASRRRATLFSE